MSTATKERPAKAAAKGTKKKQSQGVASVEHAATVTNWIRLDLIERDGQNHRLDGSANKRRIQKLANSFAAGPDAQLEPIRVYDRAFNNKLAPNDKHVGAGPRYLLGFGFRRCAAADLAGWAEIRAEILPMPNDLSEIERARAVENLQRQDLNPMEEAVAVAQYLDALPSHQFYRDGGLVAPRNEEGEGALLPTKDHDGKPRKWAIEYVAAQLGRSPAWVRDRGYLLRLGPKAREALIAGKLLLGHAREIAKLGDHAIQERMADLCKVRDDGTCHMSLEQLRQAVSQHQRSLKVMPWRLDADFGAAKRTRILGACAACPHNSSNDHQLFEHDESPAEDGYCLHDACFEAKTAACNKAVEKAVATIVRKELPATESTAVSVAAEYLKPGRIVREVKKARETAGGKMPPPDAIDIDDGPSPMDVELSPEQQAQADLDTATEKWIEESSKAIEEAAISDPVKMALLCVFGSLVDTFQLEDANVNDKYSVEFELLAQGDASSLRQLSQIICNSDDLDLSIIGDLPEAGVDLLVKGWKLPVIPRPTLVDFMPKGVDSVTSAAERDDGMAMLHGMGEAAPAPKPKVADAAFTEELSIVDPKDIDVAESELFAADQLDVLLRKGEKPKRVKHVRPQLREGFLGVTNAGRYPCVVLGATSVRGQECLRLALLERDWPKTSSVVPSKCVGKEARERIAAGEFRGITVIACNCDQVIGDVFHVRVGKAGVP